MNELIMQVYWGPRENKLEEVTRQCMSYFGVIASLEPSFQRWVEPAKSKRRALANLPVSLDDVNQIQQMLLKGQAKTDVAPRTVIPELGYRIGLWNMAFDQIDAAISIRCGTVSKFLSQEAQNLVYFRCMASKPLALSSASIQHAFKSAAEIWSPTGGRAWTMEAGTEQTISSV